MAHRHNAIRRGSLGLLVGLLLTGLTGTAAPTWAALDQAAPATGHTYIVNSTADEPDADPASGVCASTPSGRCTLRAAIMLADFDGGPDTIILPAGTYTLTRPGYDNYALVGDLDIAHDLSLQGAGSGATIVDGNGGVTHDRVFKVLSTAQTVTFSGLTIRGGQSFSSTAGTIGGGGLYIEGAGSLSLSDVSLEDNAAQNGGGLYASFSAEGGSLELDHVTVRANTVTAGGVGAGGGVFVSMLAGSSAADVHDSQVYSNTADGTGGGLFVEGTDVAHWTIERSQIYSNTAASGGGIGNFAPLSMSDSQVHDNHVTFDGGAIEAFSPLAITRSTLAGNSADRFGGALFNLPTGSSAFYNDFAEIAQSTFSGNAAHYGGAIYHDGFINYASLLTLTNSTLSGNEVFRPLGATGTADGGGLYVYDGQARLFNATIANNRVQLNQVLHNFYTGIGGGVYLTATSILTAENTLIAKNLRGNGFSAWAADDCYADSGTTGTLAYDLILNTANCSISGPQGGLITGQDPLLGPLQDNGGSTQTQALLSGSPAINAGAPTGCTDASGAPLTTDQRGAPRTDARCDIGAYEVVPEADLAVGQRASANPVRLGAPLTYTVVVTNAGPVAATGVVLTGTLPLSATLRFLSASQGSCLAADVAVSCTLGGLATGAQASVTEVLTPTATGPLTNLVGVSGDQFDPALANNAASETITVAREMYLPLVTRAP